MDKIEIAEAPTITLGGRTFPVPRLAIKQTRVVVANLQAFLPALQNVIRVVDGVDKNNPSAVAKAGQQMFAAFPLDEKAFDACCNAVYAALTRGTPTLTRAQFDELEAGADEIMAALPVVMAQSFAFARRKEGTPPLAAAGEEKPALEPAPKLTGTQSSSDSAGSSDGHGNTPKAA